MYVYTASVCKIASVGRGAIWLLPAGAKQYLLPVVSYRSERQAEKIIATLTGKMALAICGVLSHTKS